MALPFRLIALLLILLSALLAIVAAATTGWSVGTATIVTEDDYKINFGLFRMCSTSPGKVVCASTSKMFSEDSSCKARLVTTQAFIVLAIVVLFPLLVLTIVRRFLATGPAGAAASRIPALVDVVIGLIAVLCLTIAWGVFANMHKGCICPFLEDEAGCTSCGLNYSFALAIIAWLAAGAATVFLFLGKNENAGYTDLSAPTLV